MTRNDYLWIGVKMLGLRLAILATTAAFSISESLSLFQLYDHFARVDDLDGVADEAVVRRGAALVALGIAVLRALVYGCASFVFLRRTNVTVSRIARPLVGDPETPAA